MKDQFMHAFRQPPPPALSERLARRLASVPDVAAAPPAPRLRLRRLAWTMGTIVALVCLLGMSPAVRQQVFTVLRQVGGLTVQMTNLYPGTGDPDIVPTEVLALTDVQGRVPYAIGLPAWLPEGVTAQTDAVRLVEAWSGVTVYFHDADGRVVLLLALDAADPDVAYVVGPESVEKVLVNGRPATLIRGAWRADSQSWQEDGSQTLRWERDGVAYRLITWDGTIADATLIRVAESIQAKRDNP